MKFSSLSTSSLLTTAALTTAIFFTTSSAYAACCGNISYNDCPTVASTPQCPDLDKECPPSVIPAYPYCSPYAVLPGFYVGGQLGYTEVHYNQSDVAPGSPNVSDDGVGGRAYFGYQLTPNWGAEIGYTYFADVNATHVNGNNSGSIQENAIDLVGKGTLAFPDSGFNLYAKAGGAYVTRSVDKAITANLGDVNGNLLFTYGAGATYNLTRHVPIEFSWTRIQHNGTIPDSDLAAVGLAYYFG